MDADSIVLNTTEHAESDLIVTFFCAERGRLTAIAKGAKKSKKRFVNKLEHFSFLRIGYDQRINSSLAFLREAELHTAFPNIRTNIEIYRIASIIREFLLLSVKDGEPEQDLFKLSLWAFHNLDLKQPPKTILALYLVKHLGYIGYRPALEACVSCESNVSPSSRYRFNFYSGTLICASCRRHKQGGMPISNGTIKMLQAAQDISLERLHRVKITGTLLRETLNLLHNFSRQIFQREIISWKVLQQR